MARVRREAKPRMSAATSDRIMNQLLNWERGPAAWKTARAAVSGKQTKLWYEPNACDHAVLRASAPLTVLFSVTTFWREIQERRAAIGNTGKPLEVHVIGASYPFEGRSDWSLLSRSRPPEVPSVRVVLVLGTPFQSDNVPPMSDDFQTSLLQRQIHRKQPNAGYWNSERMQIACQGRGEWGTHALDDGWSKSQLCRDHGNGLKVLCLERLYADVRHELPRPDVAMLFSPGFPQLERRTWDAELRGLLQEGVPTFVSDAVMEPNWGRLVFRHGRWVPHGGHWDMGRNWKHNEPAMTLMTMRKYGARSFGALRAPFPILHHEEGDVIAKNAVVQLFIGYDANHKPAMSPSIAEVASDAVSLEDVDWEELGINSDLERSLSTPVSEAYDWACQAWYFPGVTKIVRKQGCSSFAPSARKKLLDLGLCHVKLSRPGQHYKTNIRWTSKDWVFLVKELGQDLLDLI